ncbi:putative chitinase [Microsporum ferrugineum]
MQAYCYKGKPPPKLEPRGNSDETFAEGEIKEYTALLKDAPEMLLFRRVWSSEFVTHYDSALETLSLIELLHSSHLDSRGLAERVLYDPQGTAAGIKRDRSIAKIICERTTQSSSLGKRAKSLLENGTFEEKRNSTLAARVPSGRPYHDERSAGDHSWDLAIALCSMGMGLRRKLECRSGPVFRTRVLDQPDPRGYLTPIRL